MHFAAVEHLGADRIVAKHSFCPSTRPTLRPPSLARSSSRELRIRVPFFPWSILVGGPSPKRVKGHYWGGPSWEAMLKPHVAPLR